MHVVALRSRGVGALSKHYRQASSRTKKRKKEKRKKEKKKKRGKKRGKPVLMATATMGHASWCTSTSAKARLMTKLHTHTHTHTQRRLMTRLLLCVHVCM